MHFHELIPFSPRAILYCHKPGDGWLP